MYAHGFVPIVTSYVHQSFAVGFETIRTLLWIKIAKLTLSRTSAPFVGSTAVSLSLWEPSSQQAVTMPTRRILMLFPRTVWGDVFVSVSRDSIKKGNKIIKYRSREIISLSAPPADKRLEFRFMCMHAATCTSFWFLGRRRADLLLHFVQFACSAVVK